MIARLVAACVILIVLGTTLPTSWAQDKANPSRKEQIEESAKKVKDLQKERIAILKRMVDQSLKLAANARIEMGEALEARTSLLKAELEAAEKESDRIAIYKKTLESLQEYTALAKAQMEAGRGTELSLLKIKARYLEVEIALEQAKIKEAKESK